jgi:hypothetical protein
MSTFEDRVSAGAGQLMDDRFKILDKLDPEIARRYAIGVNAGNQQRLRDGKPLSGFGRFSKKDVDRVMDAALDFDTISRKEEEALMIILAAQSQWEPGARDYFIDQLELHLKDLWSSDTIDDEAPTLLARTNRLDFVSGGDRHRGTLYHYTPEDYQLIAALIKKGEIGAWEVSVNRTYLRLPPGQAGAWGLYDDKTNDIYIVKGLDPRDRQASFTHEATHAIQDFRNLPDAAYLAKYVETDAYIAQAFIALSFGVPYAAFPDRPEEVATRGAAGMLLTPVGKRDKAWTRDFRKGYDDVVDAFIATHGTKSSNEMIDMLESATEQKREGALMKKMVQALKKP